MYKNKKISFSMSHITNPDSGTRYAELIVDSFFSRDETATYVDNSLSGRPIDNVKGLALHEAKVALTYDTIFAPFNSLTLSDYTYVSGTGLTVGTYNGVGYVGSNTNNLPTGSPNILTAQQFLASSLTTLAQNGFVSLQTNYALIPAVFYVKSTTASPGSYGGFVPLHIFLATVGLNSAGTGFNLYITVQSANGLTANDLKGTLTFTYSKYLGRKLGLPDRGTWTVDLAPLTPITSNGTTAGLTEPYIATVSGVNGGGQPTLAYYTIPFTFNAEMNMGRYLQLRGTLSSDIQSAVYVNDEGDQNSDMIAALPINGAYGDIVQFDAPNHEVFTLPKVQSIRYIKLWFTRAEDPDNTPVHFKGSDYYLKFALQIQDEDERQQRMFDPATFTVSQTSHKRMKYV